VEDVHRDILWLRHDGVCGICGQVVSLDKCTVDHIIPASRGGTHCYSNCQPAHASCNAFKADALMEELEFTELPGEVIVRKHRKQVYRNHGLGYKRKRHRKTGGSTRKN
jgi:hypothetical protein